MQRASVTSETTIRAGDQIMTGQNGGVLLVRGKETMLISPNMLALDHLDLRPVDGVERARLVLAVFKVAFVLRGERHA